MNTSAPTAVVEALRLRDAASSLEIAAGDFVFAVGHGLTSLADQHPFGRVGGAWRRDGLGERTFPSQVCRDRCQAYRDFDARFELPARRASFIMWVAGFISAS